MHLKIKNNIISTYIIFLMIAVGFTGLLVFNGVVDEGGVEAAKTLYVGSGQTYTKIQDAIDNASKGDTIRVHAGIYYEHVIVNKSVTLIGNGTANTTIDGSGSGVVVQISVDWVNITGFNITNGSTSSGGNGIRLYRVQNCRIFNNKISSNYNGIQLSYLCHNNILDNNTVLSSYYTGIDLSSSDNNLLINNTIKFSTFGPGIMLSYSDSNKISNNTISNNRMGVLNHYSSDKNTFANNTFNSNGIYGIWVGTSSGSTIIFNNTFTGGSWYGIGIISSGGNKITNNSVSLSNDGIYLYSSGSNTVINNTFSLNNVNGIHLRQSSSNTINNNIASENKENGIYFNASSNNKLINNEITNNSKGIHLYISSSNTLKNNTCNLNKDHGIFLNGGNVNQIFKNNISNNIGYGIESYGSNPNIHDNLISKNKWTGVYIRSGGNGLNVKSNDITYNSWSGIDINNSNSQLEKNNITNNTQDGIKLAGGSPVIDSNNLVNYNGWNGLACYQDSRPFITNSEFKLNGKNGILLSNSSPRVSAIAVKNKIFSNGLHGIACLNGSSGAVMADVKSNTQDGVFTADLGTNTEILNSNISNNGRNGVNATADSAPIISNSSILNNIGEAFWLDGSVNPIAINNSFADTEVWFEDTESTLTVKWHVFVKTESKATGAPVDNCRIWMNSTTQSQVAWTGRSDSSGWVKWLRITEYIEKDSNYNHRTTEAGERIMWTPHDVSGDRRDYRETNMTPYPVIDRSKTIVLKLDSNRAPTAIKGIKPMKTHNAHPTISWAPSSDMDGHTFNYQLWVGNKINTSDIHESGVLTNTKYLLPIDLKYDDDGNETYWITIVTTDDHGGQTFVPNALYLLNSKPTNPKIELSFSKPPSVELETVKCKIIVESVDPDGDEINYTYRWFKNDKKQELLTEDGTKNIEDVISVTADDIEFKKGDVWRVEVRAEDGLLETGPGGKSGWSSAEFLIDNLGPRIAEKIEDIVIDEDSELNDAIYLIPKFFDPDQDVSTLTYIAMANNENLTVTINKITHKVSFKPAINWNGKKKVNITCMDNEGLWITQWIDVAVRPINDEPKIISVGSKEVLTSIIEFQDDDAAIEDEWFNITVVASDIDIERGEDDEITFNLIDDYEKIRLTHNQPLKATLSFFPTNDEVGSYEFMVSIKDKSMKSYKQKIIIKIEVKNSNDKPELLSIKKLPSGKTYPIPVNRVLDLSKQLEVKENEALRLLVTATDPDIDEELTYHTDSVSIVEVDTNTGNLYTAEIIITPDEKSIGDFIFNIIVKDHKLEKDTVQIILVVKNVNDKPTVKIISPTEFERQNPFKPGTEIKFEGQADDPDLPFGDELVLKWISDIDGELGSGRVIYVDELSIGEHVITFKAEDSYGESSLTDIIIIVGGIDSDNDNLPDIWESLYFNSVTKYNADDDPDNDKWTNKQEYEAKTNPTDSNSHPTEPIDKPEGADKDKWVGNGANAVIGGVIILIIIIAIILIVVWFVMINKPEQKTKIEAQYAYPQPPPPMPPPDYTTQPQVQPEIPTEQLAAQAPPEMPQKVSMEQPPNEVPVEEIQSEVMEVTSEDIPPEQMPEVPGETTETTEIMNLTSKGDSAYSQGRYTDAILAWQQVLEQEPGEHPDIEMAITDAMGKIKRGVNNE